jgi:DNA-binding NarL/FixJ family response regulator
MTRAMTQADRSIVRAYADLKDVDKVTQHLNMRRERVVEVVVNVCGISHTAARALLAGHHVHYLAGRPTERQESEPRYEATPTRPADITGREYQVLVGLSEGLTYDEIALRLDRSLYTIRDHTKSAFKKLGARDRSEAVRAAVVLGVIEPPPAITLESIRAASLTSRERETLRLAATGISYAAIGEALRVSDNCVRSRLSRIYGKLGVRKQREAVDTAIRAGILSAPGDAS